MFLSQASYTKQIIERSGQKDANPVSVPEDLHTNLTDNTDSNLPASEVPYRQAVGSLMFLAMVSRPDIAHAVGVASRFFNNYTIIHWNAVKRIIRYLVGTINYGILYNRNINMQLCGYSDSDYASDRETRRSTTGYVFKLCNGPVTWSSKRQPTVSLSTTESEFIAASQATKEIVWLHKLLTDLEEEVNKPTTLYVDNQSAIKLIKNPEFHQRTKHIDVKFHFVREHYESRDILPEYINTRDQQADIFTKPLARNRFEDLRSKLGVCMKNE